MRLGRLLYRSVWKSGLLVGGLCLVLVPGARADFAEKLARVDEALKNNPERVSANSLNSCLRQRNFAVQLHEWNEPDRAERSLKYCFMVLKISEEPAQRPKTREEKIEAIAARAALEVEEALRLTADTENGLRIYRGCAECHMPEGSGMRSGLVPQLAGQHRTVVIKQLADIRAGNRETVIMAPYATVEVIGGTQAVADVAGYIDTLEISVEGGKGPGDQLELGERLYRENCANCHGENGEGNAEEFVPRIQSQHFNYLVRQFDWIREGKRRNANPEMQEQIASFSERETNAVLDYVSRLAPPAEFQAPPGWWNPDFAE